MSGTLRIYRAGTYDESGVPLIRWGSLIDPIKPVTVTPLIASPPVIYTVAVGEKIHLWQYDADRPEFSLVEVWLPDQSGNIDIGVKYAAASDFSSNPRWRTLKLGCHDHFSLSEDEGLVHPTVATDVGDTNGFPSLWGDGSTVAARVVDVAVYNPSTASAAVRVACVVVGGD